MNAACTMAQKGQNVCRYYKNRQKGVKEMSWDPIDIEEVHRDALKHEYCPYYATKDRAHAADIIFMPYNYLIDERIRENYEIKFENSLLIFDEAHNVPQAQEDVTSFELRARTLQASLSELVSLQESRCQNDQKEWKAQADQIDRAKEITSNLLKYLTSYRLDLKKDSL